MADTPYLILDSDHCSPAGTRVPASNCTDEPPAPEPAPAPAPTPGPDLTAVLTAIEGLSGRLTEIEGIVTAPQPSPAPSPTPGPPGPTPQDKKAAKALADAQAAAKAATEAQAAALALAKGALVRSHLTGIKSADYLRLAPEVELTEAGALSEDSVKALDKFREDHGDLFRSQGGGFSPMPGGKGGKGYSSEEMTAFANLGISPGSWRERLASNPALIASIDAAAKN